MRGSSLRLEYFGAVAVDTPKRGRDSSENRDARANPRRRQDTRADCIGTGSARMQIPFFRPANNERRLGEGSARRSRPRINAFPRGGALSYTRLSARIYI